MTFPINKYPPFVGRHTRSGDTNPPTRLPGGPLASRRVYIDEPPAGGFPDPAGKTYALDTTLAGHGEDVLDTHLNRAFYALHASLDSIFERESIFPKMALRTAAAGPLSSEVDMSDGVGDFGTDTNDLLVYLGPPGSIAAEAPYHMAVLNGANGTGPVGVVIRSGTSLQLDQVTDALCTSLGLSLYPLNLHLAGGPSYYPQPAAKMGVLQSIPVVNQVDITSTEGGPDTTVLPMVATCIINYSLMTRITQGNGEELHRAFAIVVSHVVGNPAVLNRKVDFGLPVGNARRWNVGDIIYFTTVAYGPVLSLDAPYAMQQGDIVASGGWTRVGDGDPNRLVMSQAFLWQQQRDLSPTVEVTVPSTVSHFGWDGWQAMFRAGIDLVRSTTGFMAIDGDEIAGSTNEQAYAAFLHGVVPFWGPIVYGDETRLDDESNNNPVTIAANMVTLTVAGQRFGQVTGHPGPLTYTTDLIKKVDLIEIWTGGAFPERLGVWLLDTPLDPGVDGDVVTFTVLNLDKTAPTDLPAVGFARIVRPLLRSGTPTASASTPILENVTLVGHKGTAPAITSVLDLIDGVATRLIRGWRRQTDGELELTFYVDSTGDVGVDGGISAGSDVAIPATSNYTYKTARTFYHQISMADGIADPAGQWKYNFTTHPNWFINPGPGTGADVLHFPVHLPQDCTIVGVDVLYGCRVLGGGAPPETILYRKTRVAGDWVAGAPDKVPVTVAVPAVPPTVTVNGVVANLNFFRAFNSAVLADVVNNELNEYFVEVLPDRGLTAGNDILYGIRIAYTINDVKPA